MYGDGPDAHSGFKSYAVYDANGQALFDSINSDAIEVDVEYDEFGAYAWDRVGEANLTLASASPDMLLALQEVLKTPGLQSGVQAMCAAAVAKATGRDVADVVKGI